MVKYLASIAEDPMFIDEYGNTPLMVAAHGLMPVFHDRTYVQRFKLKDGHVKIIEFLANQASNPLETNEERETPYHILAMAENGLKSIKFLVDLTGSDPIKFDIHHDSPLHIAAKFGNLGNFFF